MVGTREDRQREIAGDDLGEADGGAAADGDEAVAPAPRARPRAPPPPTGLGTCITACACRPARAPPSKSSNACPSRAPLPGVAITSARAMPSRAASSPTRASAPGANTTRWAGSSWVKDTAMRTTHLSSAGCRAHRLRASCNRRTVKHAECNYSMSSSRRTDHGFMHRGLLVRLRRAGARRRRAAHAQTYGFATLQPGTLNHTTASAVAKVLKEKAGLNVLVQPTAGDQVIIPMVGRGEAEIGISNAMEVHDGLRRASRTCASSPPRMRCASASSCARTAACARSPTSRASGCRTASPPCARSSRRCAPCWPPPASHEKDIKPVLVPNVIRSADDFVSGAADAFYFAFGAPKVREVDVTVGRHPHDRDRREGACRPPARSSAGAI